MLTIMKPNSPSRSGRSVDYQQYSEEFAVLENSSPPTFVPHSGSSCISTDFIDIQAFRDKSLLSPLNLYRSHSHGAADVQGSPLQKRGKLVMMDNPNEVIEHAKRPSVSTLIDLHLHKTDSKAPHQITSIHPNRSGPVSTHRSRRFRNRSEDFGRQLIQAGWDSPYALARKPLSEYLSEITAKKGQINTNIQAEKDHINTNQAEIKDQICITQACNSTDIITVGQVQSTESTHSERNPPTVGTNYTDMSGCLSCDCKCFPGGRLTVVPLMDSRDYTGIPPKERDYSGSLVPRSTKKGNHSLMSWFRSKKKSDPATGKQKVLRSECNQTHTSVNKEKACNSTDTRVEILNVDEDYKDMAEMAMDSMKEEVSQANKNRDAALVEVFELKLSIQEMGRKLVKLESHYKSLNFPSKRPGNAAVNTGDYDDINIANNEDAYEVPRVVSSWGTLCGPTKKEFCHAVVEARVGVKQFCRTLLRQLHEQSALDKIETILQAHNVGGAPNGVISKCVKYHIESLINQAFYEDFENIKFRKSGSHCVLDPRQRPLAFYKTYVGISQVGWSELVNKETSAYSESFDGFCDQKMSKLVEEVLHWDVEGWPDELAKAFFVAAKWVWLVHLLAFSFENPAAIFRVGTEAHFDPLYMEELPMEHVTESGRTKLHYHGNNIGKSSEHNSPQILAMVMPGFFFNSYEVIRCKVMLSSLSSWQPYTPK